MIRGAYLQVEKTQGPTEAACKAKKKKKKDMYQTTAKLAKVARARLRPKNTKAKKKCRLSGTGHIPRPV